MIVREVTVEGFKCFASAVTVSGFSEGLNVVYAPNGTGKSTLFEAIRRALIDHHGVSGKDAESMRPWDRTLPPTVWVTLDHAGERWRVHKRFLDAATCELSRWDSAESRFIAVERGERADERVRMMLGRTGAPRGLSREAHWGLAQVLWAPQGAIELGPLAPELAARVRESLAAQVVGARGAAIEAAVGSKYNAYFTPATGKLRVGKRASQLVSLQNTLEQARAGLARAKENYERARQCEARVLALQERCAAHETSVRESEHQVRERERARDTIMAQQTRAIEASMRMRESESALREARAEWDTLKRARNEIEAQTRALDEALQETDREQMLLETERLSLAEAVAREQASEQAEEALGASEGALARAARAVAHHDAIVESAQRLAALDRAIEAVVQSEGVLRDTPAPTSAVLKRSRQLQADRASTLAALEAHSLTLTLTVERAMVVHQGAQTVSLEAGERHVVRAPGRIALTLEGLASVSVIGDGLSDATAKLLDKKQQIEAIAAALVADWGTDDADELMALTARRNEVERAHAQACARRDALLTSARREVLVERIARAREALTSLNMGDPIEALAGAREAHERVLEALSRVGSSRDARATRGQRERAVQGIAERLALSRERTHRAKDAVEAAQGTVSALEARGLDEHAALRRIEHNELAFDAARTAEAHAKRALDGLENAREEVQRAMQRHKQELALLQQARDGLRTEEGRLDELRNGATFAVLGRAEEELADREQDLARQMLEAEAIKLLHETLTAARSEAVARVSGEVEREAMRVLSALGQSPAGTMSLTVSEDFSPLSVRTGTGLAVPLGALSGGEREQVHFAVRLALAAVLAREERPMVVLDDVLVATDDERLTRVVGVLEAHAKDMQIIVLTCHPERYRAAIARHIDLRAVREGATAVTSPV
ncbi:MAG: AAA family ATPase [Deltaproteobacteria bacterium]|nr:AAA family ATPase [Deltaproteobacteria bacterium]